MSDRPGESVRVWLLNPLLLGICGVSVALWNRWAAALVVVFLTVGLAVSERLVYWQGRKLEALENQS